MNKVKRIFVIPFNPSNRTTQIRFQFRYEIIKSKLVSTSIMV